MLSLISIGTLYCERKARQYAVRCRSIVRAHLVAHFQASLCEIQEIEILNRRILLSQLQHGDGARFQNLVEMRNVGVYRRHIL